MISFLNPRETGAFKVSPPYLMFDFQHNWYHESFKFNFPGQSWFGGWGMWFHAVAIACPPRIPLCVQFRLLSRVATILHRKKPQNYFFCFIKLFKLVIPPHRRLIAHLWWFTITWHLRQEHTWELTQPCEYPLKWAITSWWWDQGSLYITCRAGAAPVLPHRGGTNFTPWCHFENDIFVRKCSGIEVLKPIVISPLCTTF